MGGQAINRTMAVRVAMAGLALAAAVAGATLGAGSASAGSQPLSSVERWAFAIGNHTLDGDADAVGDRYSRFDLVVLDGEEARPADISAIQSHGTIVLLYLSVGTIEKWRAWYPDLKPYRLNAWKDWKDEWFADTSKQGFRSAIQDIAADLLAKGPDGLFLDNVDLVETAGHKHQRAGMGELVAGLDTLTSADGLHLFDQNGAPGMLDGYPNQGVDPLYTHFDGWNREDVSWTWDFDRHRYKPVRGDRALHELDKIAAQGLFTTATDYVDLDDHRSGPECESVANAEDHGALDYVADIGLTLKAVKANPPDCG
jgi:endo-alpha-1,4-polygalactosaminidase (GH114 family)